MKNKNLEFIVSASNEESFKRTLQIIYGFIANNEDVPHVPVKYLLSILLSKDNFKLKTYAQKAKKASKYACDFIVKYQDYQLDWKLKENQIGNSTKYDFRLFAQVILQAYFQFDEENGNKFLKDEAVHFFYKALSEELDISKMTLKKEKITNYSLYVMTGVFSISAGHRISNEKNPKPKEIFQSVRNSLKSKIKIT